MLNTRILRGTLLAAVLAVAGIALGAGAAFADSTTSTPAITATITTAANTNIFFAVSPDGTTGLVTDYQGSGQAYLIDMTTHAVIAAVPGITSSVAATFSPDGKSVYVSQDSADQILKIDVATHAVTATLQLPPVAGGSNVWKIVISPDGRTGYATGYHTTPATLFVFTASTMTNTQAVPLLAESTGASLSPDGSKIYVAGGTSVQVLSTSTFATLSTISVPGAGHLLESAISADGATLAVTDVNNSTVSVINTATDTVTQTVHTPSAFGVAVAPDGKTAYVTNFQGNSVSVVTTATGVVRATVALPVGTTPSGIVASADGRYEYVSNQGNGTVTVLANLAAPVVVTNPVSATVAAGGTHTFTATASGLLTPTVQWQTSTDGGKTWTNIAGATGTSYLTGALTVGQSGTQYRAVFTNASGTATTTPAIITVTAPTQTATPSTTVPTTAPIPTAVDAGLATPRSSGSPALTVLGGVLLGLGAAGMVLAGRLRRNRRGNHS